MGYLVGGSGPTYYENNHTGMTQGSIQLAVGFIETSWQFLDIEKHPSRVSPTVILTAYGENANVNTFTYDIAWDASYQQWKWKGAVSANSDPSELVSINYLVISTWA
jgi:hypothetical protein